MAKGASAREKQGEFLVIFSVMGAFPSGIVWCGAFVRQGRGGGVAGGSALLNAGAARGSLSHGCVFG